MKFFLGVIFLFLICNLHAQTYYLNNNAYATGPNCFTLTNAVTNQRGSVWFSPQLDLNNSFDIEFTMNFGVLDDPGADGMAFVLQRIGNTAIGATGGAFAYAGITPSIAVEFDTYQNNSRGDPKYDHIALISNGNESHSVVTNLAGPVAATASQANIEDSLDHKIRILWHPLVDSLLVYFDCQLRIATKYNIRANIFSGNTQVIWGFTGSTGGSVNIQKVCLTQTIVPILKDTTICRGDTVQISAPIGTNYVWTPSVGISNTLIRTPKFYPTTTTRYYVTYLDDCNVTKKDSVFITVNLSAIANAGPKQISCQGNIINLNGTIGGSASSLTWSAPSGTFGNINLGNTTYTPSITSDSVKLTLTTNDPLGSCPAVVSTMVVVVNPKPTITVSPTNNICFGDNKGIATATASGGTPGYNYSWNTSPIQNTVSAIGLVSGTYTVTITDSKGCINSDSIIITDPTELIANESHSDILCNGELNGTATITASGGTPPYLGVGLYSGLSAGIKNYTITDTKGCAASVSFTIIQPMPLVVSEIHNPIDCYGSNTSVSISATGGTPPYNGIGIFNQEVGSHTYIITDASGCNNSISVSLSQPTPLSISESHTSIILCNGNSNVTISATGGTTPYSGVGIFSQPAGTKTYVVTDANGCSGSISVTVSSPNSLNAIESHTPIDCNGGTSIVTISGSGGTPPYTGIGIFNQLAGPHSYIITDAAGCNSTINFIITEPDILTASELHNNLLCHGEASNVSIIGNGGTLPYIGTGSFTQLAGTTNYNISDANGCLSATTVNIIEPSLLSLNESHTSILCNGGLSTVIISATGGTAPYTGVGTFTQSVGAQTYIVTDANGCSSSITINITEPSVLNVSETHTAILCNGGNSLVSITATGGTAPYSGIGTFNQSAGAQTYTVSDANGCSNTITVNISEPLVISINESHIPILCNGGTSLLTITATGGTFPYTGTGNFTEVAGIHNYQIQDYNGCNASITINIIQPNLLVATESHSAISCFGETAAGTINATGGTAPYTGVGTFTQSAGSQIYVVTDLNGCTASVSAIITQPTKLTAIESHTLLTGCNSNSTVTISAAGGLGPYTGTGNFIQPAGTQSYSVSDANGCLTSISTIVTSPAALSASESHTSILCNGGTSVVTISATGGLAPYIGTGNFTQAVGTQSYSVKDANNCIVTLIITVTEPPILVANESHTSILCTGGSSTVSLNAYGGTAPYIGVGQFNQIAGTKNYIITDVNGCSANITNIITEPSLLTIGETHTNIDCKGDISSVTITSSGGTAPYTGVGIFSQQAGTQIYSVTDANGCSASISVTINEPTALNINESHSAILCNSGLSVVTITGNGGTFPYSGTGIFNQVAGSQVYNVTDANGCTSSITNNIVQPTLLVLDESHTPILCNGENSSITITATGGTASYIGTGVFVKPAGLETYIVTDANGCAASITANISEPTSLYISEFHSPISCNGGFSNVTIIATGGTAPYSGVGIFSQSAGTQAYTVTDANGCTSTITVSITDPSFLSVSETHTAILCNTGTSLVTLSAVGGTAPYFGIGTFSQDAGSHTYSITDANGCSSSITINITEPSVLNVSETHTAILCNGGNSLVSITATGGTAPYSGIGTFNQTAGTQTYIVTEANGCSSTVIASIVDPSVLSLSETHTTILCNGGSSLVTITAAGGTSPYIGIGTFSQTVGAQTYIVTDANGCSSSITINITEPSVLSLSETHTAILCNGGNSSVTITATGGTAPYSGIGAFNQTAGTQTYSVTDANGCSSTVIASIVDPSVLSLGETHTTILCNGGSSSVTLSATGGTAPYSGLGTFNQTAGTQTYSVTDANGCSSSITINIAEPQLLNIIETHTAILCNGGNSSVTISATGGLAPYNGVGTFTQLAGTQTYTITDANNCLASILNNIIEPSSLIISTNVTPASCSGNPDGTITINAIGASAPYQYTLNGSVYQNSNILFVNAGTYNNISIKDVAGCVSRVYSPVVVNLNNNLQLNLTKHDTTICEYASIKLNPTVSPNNTIINWSSNDGYSSNEYNPSLSPIKSTTYYITAHYGVCSKLDSIHINLLLKPAVVASSGNIICYNSTALLSAQIRDTSGPVSFLWTPVNLIVTPSIITTNTLPLINSQVFKIEVRDLYGCNFISTAQALITVRRRVEVFAGNDTIVPIGMPVMIQATDVNSSGISQWEWSNINNSGIQITNPYISNPTIIANNEGYLSVYGSTPEGCNDKDSILVRPINGPELYVPNAFTPNSDGLNDTFKPVYVGIRTLDYFRIYNRYGEIVFYTNNINEGWNGWYKGKQQPLASYVWECKAISITGNGIVKKGNVVLIR